MHTQTTATVTPNHAVNLVVGYCVSRFSLIGVHDANAVTGAFSIRDFSQVLNVGVLL